MPNSWTVELEEDKTTGELVLPFPPELLSQMGWTPGTELRWIDNQDGTYSIKEKKDKGLCGKAHSAQD
jgi:hypothetical protein